MWRVPQGPSSTAPPEAEQPAAAAEPTAAKLEAQESLAVSMPAVSTDAGIHSLFPKRINIGGVHTVPPTPLLLSGSVLHHVASWEAICIGATAETTEPEARQAPSALPEEVAAPRASAAAPVKVTPAAVTHTPVPTLPTASPAPAPEPGLL